MNYNKLPTGKYIHLAEPKVYHDEITQTYKCVNKVSVQIYQMAETHIVQAIIDYAKEQGIIDLFLIDEDFVKSALLNEKARREKLTLKPQTNFDKITSSVDALVEYVIKNFHNYPEAIPCLKDGCDSQMKTDCIECFKKWLEQECE